MLSRQKQNALGSLLRIKPPNVAVISSRYISCELHKANQFADCGYGSQLTHLNVRAKAQSTDLFCCQTSVHLGQRWLQSSVLAFDAQLYLEQV